MYDSIDLGRIDFSALPKRLVASQIAYAAATGDPEKARRTFYKLLHAGSIVPPQLDQGGNLTWDRDIFEAHVNLDVVKDCEGVYVWHESGKPVPVCPGFIAKYATAYRPIGQVA